MADLSQVEAVLVSTLAQLIYPAGTANPSIVARPVRVHRGWPIPAQLDKDLKAGVVTVSVYPTDTEKRTTRYRPEWREISVAVPTLTLAASGNTLVVGGAVSPGQNACAVVSGTAYVYPVQPSDTLASVATGLASLINAGTDAVSSGGTVTIPGASSLAGRVGTLGTAIREIRRQKRTFQVTFWCASPQVRDAVASAVDLALADIDYLALPDGSRGRLLYERSRVDDGSQKEGLYRRDLFYSVEYATTQARAAATIVAPFVSLRDFDARELLAEQGPPGITLQAGARLVFQTGRPAAFNLGSPTPANMLQGQRGRPLAFQAGAIIRLRDDAPQTGTLAIDQGGGVERSQNGSYLRFNRDGNPNALVTLSAQDGSPLAFQRGGSVVIRGMAIDTLLALQGGGTLIFQNGNNFQLM